MNFKEIDAISDLTEKKKKVSSSITRKNYNGDALSKGLQGSWCISDIVHQYDDSVSATMASMHIHGKTTKGRYKGQSIVGNMEVKLKVLTRQACYSDSDGNRLSTDPLTDEFVLFTDQPIDGDIVRVKHGQKMLDPDSEEEYTLKELNYLKLSGQPTYNYTDYVVKDGHVVVNGADAHQMLSTKGKRLVIPEFSRAHTAYQKEPTVGKKRRITNWLFEEVANVIEEPKPKIKRTRKPVVQSDDN